jgi:diacylglycerol kinase (ATP)
MTGTSAATLSPRFRGSARIRVIWNASAGKKAGIPGTMVTEERIRQLMARARLGEELVATATPDDARAQAGDAVRREYDLVVAAGGDGTVGTVAEWLLGTRTALGILPLGTVMNIARSLGIPRDLDAAADVIATGNVREIDVGEVDGRPFFETASVGMNAAMFREAQRFEDGDWSSIVRTVWVALRYRPARMTIDLDDRQIRTRALMVTISNGPYTGAGMTVAPAARLDDGTFDVRIFRRFSKPRLLRHLVSIAFGRYRYAPEVDTCRSRLVRIEGASPLPTRADSRDLGTTPVEFVVRPHALRMVVPAAGPIDDALKSASTSP